MRKPSEYIAAAVRGIRANAMGDCAMSLRHGETVATVTRVGSRSRGEDEVAENGPEEALRVLALAADFPCLSKGDAVELDRSLRVVTSARTDPAAASLHIGLSAAFERRTAAYSGSRRENGAARAIAASFDVLVLDNGTAGGYSDAIAPSYEDAFLVALRRDDWHETSDPEPSDTLVVAPDGADVTLKVSAVTRHDGWFVLKCRAKD